MRCRVLFFGLSMVARPAAADPAADPATPAPTAPPTAPAPATAPESGEVIVLSARAPAETGTVRLDAEAARRTAGALGEPLRALALLPGITTSIAASGYPIIRGTLPGESRFTFDGIELPQLYHLLFGNQIIHPSFVGELEVRAGGHGASVGGLLGGAVELTPAAAAGDRRTEVRANLLELGAFHAQRLGAATAIAAAARIGTLAVAAKLYDPDATVQAIDQQTRLVHRLGNGDELVVTSLGAFDYVKTVDVDTETVHLGFHRLDLRWQRARGTARARAGITTQFDTLRTLTIFAPEPPSPVMPDPPPPQPPRREGGRAYGLRAYADASMTAAPWLAARGGIEARGRAVYGGDSALELTEHLEPYLAPAQAIDAEGAWAEVELRDGRVGVTPGVRVDSFHAAMAQVDVRRRSVDPRLAITLDLPRGVRAELDAGIYSAPPQVSVTRSSVVLGPLPMAEGTGANAGLSRSQQIQASLRLPLGTLGEASLAAYRRATRAAIDFGLVDRRLPAELCPETRAAPYRGIETRALGLEAMARGSLGPTVRGWVSFSLAAVERELGALRIPHDFDQRHSLAAAASWEVGGGWQLGASALVRTGRPALYPERRSCGSGDDVRVTIVEDPTRMRRLPATVRVDLRAERAFHIAGRRASAYLDIQNASLTREVIGYDRELTDPVDPTMYRVVEKTLFLPLPMLGIEVEL